MPYDVICPSYDTILHRGFVAGEGVRSFTSLVVASIMAEYVGGKLLSEQH